MGKLADGGLERGNFIYIDTAQQDYAEQVKTALSDSLAMAMEGGGSLKMQVRSELLDFDKKYNTEFNYAIEDESDDSEEE